MANMGNIKNYFTVKTNAKSSTDEKTSPPTKIGKDYRYYVTTIKKDRHYIVNFIVYTFCRKIKISFFIQKFASFLGYTYPPQ
jgi:hypothetical protein